MPNPITISRTALNAQRNGFSLLQNVEIGISANTPFNVLTTLATIHVFADLPADKQIASVTLTNFSGNTTNYLGIDLTLEQNSATPNVRGIETISIPVPPAYQAGVQKYMLLVGGVKKQVIAANTGVHPEIEM